MNKTLVRFLCLLLPVRRWRYVCRRVLTEGSVNWWRKRQGIRLFYWRERNFGDRLNENLMQLLGCPYEGSPAYFADAVCIGSLLEEFLLRKQGRIQRPVHVFGTGFIREAEPGRAEQFHRPMIFHALRGRLSLERCCAMTGANPEEIVLGDPGRPVLPPYGHHHQALCLQQPGAQPHPEQFPGQRTGGKGNLPERLWNLRKNLPAQGGDDLL